MPRLSQTSKTRRDTCHQENIDVLDEAIKHYNFSVIWGFRGEKSQNRAFRSGNSRNRWPTSRHNKQPSNAFDIVPYPGGYEASYEEFYEMATYVLAAASMLGVKLKWGGHWKNYTGKGDNDRDWAHFQRED